MQSTPKILVVDDELFIISLIEKILQGTGYQILKAYDGEEALRKVSESNPDLIVLDVNMPKLNGLEVCRRLKSSEDTRLIPIVMLTSKDFVEDKITGLEKGADDYITKPFNAKEFALRIKGLIERRLYQRKKSEDEKLEALEKMLESVAHEVRNPIVAIGGFARRIRERLPAEDNLRMYADHIAHEVERLETMLNEIIKLKTIVVSLDEHVDITNALESALQQFQSSIKAKQISVQKNFIPALPLIHGDSGHLKKTFCNLIENAVEAMDNGGVLSLTVQPHADKINVIISDSGIGISESELSQIVRPFYTSKMSGAGMGLAMVKHILALHGGDIHISSIKGSGTEVFVTIPASAVSAQNA